MIVVCQGINRVVRFPFMVGARELKGTKFYTLQVQLSNNYEKRNDKPTLSSFPSGVIKCEFPRGMFGYNLLITIIIIN